MLSIPFAFIWLDRLAQNPKSARLSVAITGRTDILSDRRRNVSLCIAIHGPPMTIVYDCTDTSRFGQRRMQIAPEPLLLASEGYYSTKYDECQVGKDMQEHFSVCRTVSFYGGERNCMPSAYKNARVSGKRLLYVCKKRDRHLRRCAL